MSEDSVSGMEVDVINVDINVTAKKGTSEIQNMVSELDELEKRLRGALPLLEQFQRTTNNTRSRGVSNRSRRVQTPSPSQEQNEASRSERIRVSDWRQNFIPRQQGSSEEIDNSRYVSYSSGRFKGMTNEDIERQFRQPIAESQRNMFGSWFGDFEDVAASAKMVAETTKANGDVVTKYEADLGNVVNMYEVINGIVTKIYSKTKSQAELERERKKEGLGVFGEGKYEGLATSAKKVSETTKSNGDVVAKYEEDLGNIVNMYEVINGIVTKIYNKTKSQAELERERKKQGLGVFGEGDYKDVAASAKMVAEKKTAAGTFQTFQTTQKSLFGPETITTYKVVNGIIQEISEGTRKAAGNTRRMDSLLTSAKHVIKYRAISTAINLVNKGLSEGVQNAALFNSQVNESISDVVSSTLQLTNQIGSAAGELIVAFSPALVGLIDIVTIATDKLTQLFAALNGKTYYDKAVAQAYDFAKSMRSAYSGIGIDELNLFGQGGTGGALSGMKYEKAELDEWAKSLSEVRIGGETVLGFISDNIGLIAGSIVTIKGVSAGITFSKSFMDFLNPTLSTGGVIGAKTLLDHIEQISIIAGAIALGIGGDMLMNGNPEDDLLGMIVTYIGTALGIKGVTGMAFGTALQVSIPITFLLVGGFKLTEWFMGSPGVSSGNLSDKMEDVADTMKVPPKTYIWDEWDSYWDFATSNKVELLFDLANGLLSPLDNLAESISAFIGGRTLFPETNSYKEPGSQTSGGYGAPATLPATSPSDVFDDVDYTSFAPDADVSSGGNSGQYYSILSSIYGVLRMIESKDTSVVLSDDDVGRAYDRYRNSHGVVMNGG